MPVTFPNSINVDGNRGQFAVFTKHSDGSNNEVTCWHSYDSAVALLRMNRRSGYHAALYVDGKFSPVLER
jgi:hypothetical protein